VSSKKNILNNSIANILQKGVRILEQLLLVPFFITAWGAAYYGEWLTLTIIPSVLAFSDLGFGSAAANSFVLKYASGDKQGAANISKTGFSIISYAVVLGVLLSVGVMLLGSYFGWFDKSLIPASDAIKVLPFMIAARLIGFYSQLFCANYVAARRAALGINLGTVGSALHLAAGAVVLWFGGNIVVYALWQFIVSIGFNVFYWINSLHILGLYREIKGKYDKTIAKDIFSKGFGYLMSPVWQTILFQGTTFVVRLTLGPVAVAVFNTVRTLTRSVNQIYSVVNGSIRPELQYEMGAGNLPKAQKIFIYSIRTTFVLSLLGFVFLALFGLPLYNWWTHKALIPPQAMWYVFLSGILVNALWWTAGTVFGALNKPYQLAVSGVISAVIAIFFSYLCAKIWGLTGAAIGSFIFEVLMMIYILPASCRLMGVKIFDLFNVKK
jgi:O-antigen/teichoic acid export membrane protein